MNPDKLLIKRYLIWCFKTTKEDLDRVDRYFTQNTVDQYMLDHMYADQECEAIKDKVDDFAHYMEVKTSKANAQKFVDEQKKEIHPDYLYLQKRFEAIVAAIKHFLGDEALTEIVNSYEEEFTRRIWEAREHT